jgi:hypothetical protein
MTYEEKKAWLGRYREAEKKYNRLSERLAEAQTATRRITQNISAIPGGSGDGQSLARAVEREEEAERKAYAQRAVCDKLFAEIDPVLRQLDDNRNYSILRRYYLDLQTWERIADETNYSVRRIYAIRKSCVERLNI